MGKRKRRPIIVKDSVPEVAEDRDDDNASDGSSSMMTTVVQPKYSKPDNDDDDQGQIIEENLNDPDLASQVFLNPLIMKKIVQHLPLADLPKVRLTGHAWNKAMIHDLRQLHLTKRPIMINSFSLHSVLDAFAGREACDLPFTKYEFEDVSFLSLPVQTLMKQIGPIVTHLKLHLKPNTNFTLGTFKALLLDQVPNLESLEMIDTRTGSMLSKFWKCKLQLEEDSLPNLKKLAFGFGSTAASNQLLVKSSHHLASDLINVSINLEYFGINIFDDQIQQPGKDLLIETLKRKTSNLGKIKVLKSNVPTNMGRLQSLIALSQQDSPNQLKLQKFNFESLHLSTLCQRGQQLLTQFLALQGDSLRKLTATRTMSYGHDFIEVQLGRMPALKYLKLTPGWWISSSRINTKFDGLAASFPALEKLVLDLNGLLINVSQVGDADWIEFKGQLLGSYPQPHPGVLELQISLNWDRKDESSVTNPVPELGLVFPNLSILKITLWNHLMPELWSIWPALQVLEITMNECTGEKYEFESVFTGIPVDILEQVEKSMRNINLRPDHMAQFVDWNWKGLKFSPGFADLKCLREFQLKFKSEAKVGDGVGPIYAVTDLIGYYAFCVSSSPQLKKIHIDKYSNFSLACVTAIEKKLGQCGTFTYNN